MDAGTDLDALQERLGYRFADPDGLLRALRHGSWCAEHGDVESNERLEFLGDAVVELTVRAELYRTQPDRPEGELSKLRRSVVNTYALARAAERTGLGEALLLGRGEDASGGRTKPSLLCNALEAVVGATFLDGGWDAASALALRLVDQELAAAVLAGPDSDDPKTVLQELAARLGAAPPAYEVVHEGPEHDKWFTATVTVQPGPGAERAAHPDPSPVAVGHGGGQSKKMAEQQAARDALRALAPTSAAAEPQKIGSRDA